MVDLAARLAGLEALRARLPASARGDLDMLIGLLKETMRRASMRDTDEAAARSIDRFLAIDDVPVLCERLKAAADAMRLFRTLS
jgi:hypothetical protein